MKRGEAISRLKSVNTSGKRSEEEVKQRLIGLLKSLNSGEYSPEHHLMLEEELEHLFEEFDSSSASSGKKLKFLHEQLQVFLYRNFSLIPDGHYGGLGMLYGVLSGGFLLSFSHLYMDSFYRYLIPMAAMIIGLIIGSFLDENAEKNGRTLLFQKKVPNPLHS